MKSNKDKEQPAGSSDKHGSSDKQMKGSKQEKPKGMSAMMAAMGKATKEYSKEEIELALAVAEVERTIKNVGNYKNALMTSPEEELNSLLNALKGGYTAPTPGGDPIANPNALPTGRNMYAINAEATPTESAWEKGIALAKQTIDTYKQRHNDSIPRKVSYTLWSSEFIETGGATIAQVLYMLGVEPVRDAFGRVSDLKLIPSAELGRPRIDVVVQTSGQLRDIAASRLFLINRAVEMAATAKDDKFENQVAASVIEAERVLTEKVSVRKMHARWLLSEYSEVLMACMVQEFREWWNPATVGKVNRKSQILTSTIWEPSTVTKNTGKSFRNLLLKKH